jgi:hypothetical protein
MSRLQAVRRSAKPQTQQANKRRSWSPNMCLKQARRAQQQQQPQPATAGVQPPGSVAIRVAAALLEPGSLLRELEGRGARHAQQHCCGRVLPRAPASATTKLLRAQHCLQTVPQRHTPPAHTAQNRRAGAAQLLTQTHAHTHATRAGRCHTQGAAANTTARYALVSLALACKALARQRSRGATPQSAHTAHAHHAHSATRRPQSAVRQRPAAPPARRGLGAPVFVWGTPAPRVRGAPRTALGTSCMCCSAPDRLVCQLAVSAPSVPQRRSRACNASPPQRMSARQPTHAPTPARATCLASAPTAGSMAPAAAILAQHTTATLQQLRVLQGTERAPHKHGVSETTNTHTHKKKKETIASHCCNHCRMPSVSRCLRLCQQRGTKRSRAHNWLVHAASAGAPGDNAPRLLGAGALSAVRPHWLPGCAVQTPAAAAAAVQSAQAMRTACCAAALGSWHTTKPVHTRTLLLLLLLLLLRPRHAFKPGDTHTRNAAGSRCKDAGQQHTYAIHTRNACRHPPLPAASYT